MVGLRGNAVADDHARAVVDLEGTSGSSTGLVGHQVQRVDHHVVLVLHRNIQGLCVQLRGSDRNLAIAVLRDVMMVVGRRFTALIRALKQIAAKCLVGLVYLVCLDTETDVEASAGSTMRAHAPHALNHGQLMRRRDVAVLAETAVVGWRRVHDTFGVVATARRGQVHPEELWNGAVVPAGTSWACR